MQIILNGHIFQGEHVIIREGVLRVDGNCIDVLCDAPFDTDDQLIVVGGRIRTLELEAVEP